jgi:hypothetical protein
MIAGAAFTLLAAAAVPCEGLSGVRLDKATITGAQMVAEGPAPAPVPARAGGRVAAAALA